MIFTIEMEPLKLIGVDMCAGKRTAKHRSEINVVTAAERASN